jgi:hypothetical protein
LIYGLPGSAQVYVLDMFQVKQIARKWKRTAPQQSTGVLLPLWFLRNSAPQSC